MRVRKRVRKRKLIFVSEISASYPEIPPDEQILSVI